MKRDLHFSEQTKGTRRSTLGKLMLGLTALIAALSLSGQDLEPRTLSNAPIGLNFLVAGYGYSTGNVLFDPSVPIEGATAKVHRAAFAYLRTIDFFGLSGKVDVIVPFVIDRYWEGMLAGQPASTTRTGFPYPIVGGVLQRLAFYG